MVSGHNIVVIGASAGGVEALLTIVKKLPVDFPAAIFVVLHVAPLGKSVLPALLSRAGLMPAIHSKDREPIQPGHIYVAPPDYHMVVKHGYIRLSRGPKENGHRPAADPLFRTAAAAYGPHVVGVVLSGTRDDGTAGLLEIRKAGGITIAQDPNDAAYPGMPKSAIETMKVDYILSANDIPATLQQLAHDPIKINEWTFENSSSPDVAEIEGSELEKLRPIGVPSSYVCPDCGGVLWETEEKGLVHFRCRVGHAWGPESLLEEQAESLEEALWVALRALEDHASLSTRIAKSAHERLRDSLAVRFEKQAADIQRRAGVIRRLLAKGITGESERKSEEPDEKNESSDR